MLIKNICPRPDDDLKNIWFFNMHVIGLMHKNE